MLAELITPHDAFQDSVLFVIAIATIANAWFLYAHLKAHQRHRESGEPI